MDTFEAIRSRRAVKHYDPEHQMPAADERKLMEHALLAPTSYNIQNWRFVLVKDPEQRSLIRKAAWDQAQITEASLLIVLTADMGSWNDRTERYWTNAPRSARCSWA